MIFDIRNYPDINEVLNFVQLKYGTSAIKCVTEKRIKVNIHGVKFSLYRDTNKFRESFDLNETNDESILWWEYVKAGNLYIEFNTYYPIRIFKEAMLYGENVSKKQLLANAEKVLSRKANIKSLKSRIQADPIYYVDQASGLKTYLYYAWVREYAKSLL